MDRDVLVYVDLQGRPQLVGRLWSRLRRDRETATFEYDKNWLAHQERFSLEPALKLGPGPFHAHSDKPLFGAMMVAIAKFTQRSIAPNSCAIRSAARMIASASATSA